MIQEVIDKPLYISRKRSSKFYVGDTQPHVPHKKYISFLSRNKVTNDSLSDSRATYRVRWGSLHISLVFPNKKYSNLPASGDMGEVPLQIGVETKAGIEIGRDQEGVITDSHGGIEYLRLGGARQEECSFNVYIGGMNRVPMYRQFCIKLVTDGLAIPSPPEIAMYAASLCLKRQRW